jgi:2-polyprenyl-3-methyl-5-hydroxy-6-metoxy-1,4-benzoquinol methylase
MNPAGSDPRSMTPQWLRSFQRTFGFLTDSLPPGSRVLDLGCGTGYLLRWLARQRHLVPFGVDSSPDQVAVGRAGLPGIEIHCDDGLTFLHQHLNTFAGIFCIDVLEHIPGDDLMLEWVERARDALVPGGFFCCRMPNAANLFGCHSRYVDITHERSFTSSAALQLLEAAGLCGGRIVPIRGGTWLGSLCLSLETLLHKALFRLTSRWGEEVFTNNVCAVGYKK